MTEIRIRIPDTYAALIDDGLLTVADFEQSLQHAADASLYTALTPSQQHLLIEGSGLSPAGKAAVSETLSRPAALAHQRVAAAAADRAAHLTATCTAREAGNIVGRDTTTITRWHRSRALLGFLDAGGALRVPCWQVTPNGPLPGLPIVVAHRGELSLPSLAAVMTEPNDELDGATPAEWLTNGGDPTRVGDILDGMNRW